MDRAVRPVHAVDAVFADPQVEHLAMIRRVEHPVLGELRLGANPATPAELPREIGTAAPELGAHTAETLHEPGLRDADVERPARAGVLGP